MRQGKLIIKIYNRQIIVACKNILLSYNYLVMFLGTHYKKIYANAPIVLDFNAFVILFFACVKNASNIYYILIFYKLFSYIIVFLC